MKKNNKWFSIIEILVWIFIFSIGLVSVMVLIISTGNMNSYSKNSIIASNLARESLEIVKNVRDTNYLKLTNWNKLPWNDFNSKFSTGVYYKVENDFLDKNKLAKFDVITDFWEWKSNLTTKMENYRLYLTKEGYYTYDNSNLNSKTNFYRYIKFEEINESWTILPGTLKVISKVIWYEKWYHEVRIDTIITDWQKQ